LALAQPFVVAVKENALLLCTLAHAGPHSWPGGEVVDDPLAFLPPENATAPIEPATDEPPVPESPWLESTSEGQVETEPDVAGDEAL
jgi:hypothetical protein